MEAHQIKPKTKTVEIRSGPGIDRDTMTEALCKAFGSGAQATPTADGGLSFQFEAPSTRPTTPSHISVCLNGLSIAEQDDTSHDILSLPLRIEGDGLVKKKKYDVALRRYKQAIRLVVGDDFEVPVPFMKGGGVRSEKYIEMGFHKLISLMGCCHEIGKCYMVMNNYKEVWKLRFV